jgi:peptide deformylase
MALLKVITEPDPRVSKGSGRLREVSKPVTSFDARLRQLAIDMHETMAEENGVGLAAPQVGILERMVVIHVPEGYGDEDQEEQTLTLVNPEIVKAGGRDYDYEGCLSFPDLIGEVPRYTWVNVKAQDETGKALRFRARGILARIIQHEIDHLDGVLFFDRMEDWSTLGYPRREGDVEEEEEITA